MEKNNCKVCMVSMIDSHFQGKMKPRLESHFHLVCDEHFQHGKTFLIDVVAENLGYKDIEKDRKCEACNKMLTNDEVQKSLHVNSLHLLCEKHLDKYAKEFMLPKKNK